MDKLMKDLLDSHLDLAGLVSYVEAWIESDLPIENLQKELETIKKRLNERNA